MSAFIVTADTPSYVPVGGNELMLLGEFSRTVPVECASCGHSEMFKLIADELLDESECDRVLEDHLREFGWRVDADDICPVCTGGAS